MKQPTAPAGVHPTVAQTLARHSTITLTMDSYTHSVLGEPTAAPGVLPDLLKPSREAARVTGTDGANLAEPRLALCLVRLGGREASGGCAGRREASEERDDGTSDAATESSENARKKAERTGRQLNFLSPG
jgi:hypothetical protein